MATPLISVPWDACLLEPRRDPELERFARRRMGFVAPAIPYLASRPWVVRTLVFWHGDYGMLMHLDLDLADLIAMAVSQENSCRYCYAATRWLLRIRGMSERRVQDLERQLTGDDLDARTVAAVRYARAMSRAAPLPGTDDRERLRAAGFSAEEHRDLAFVVASTALANRLHTIIAVPPEAVERDASGWRPILQRPLALPIVRRLRRRPGRPTDSTPPCEGAYVRLLQRYAGTPIAPVVEAAVKEMSASTVLAPRLKALVFAVVAHALGCKISAAEARAMLPQEDSADDLAQVLAHLGGPGVDPLESAVASFVRDTVWYTPLEVQRRARALQAMLPTEQFVEVVGVASLANSLCRLAAAVLEP